MPTNEAEAPPGRLWLPLEAALLLRGDEHGPHEIEYVPSSTLSEVWVAFQALFDMVNCALDSRDALLISKTSATMLKAEKLLAARDAALSAGEGR